MSLQKLIVPAALALVTCLAPVAASAEGRGRSTSSYYSGGHGGGGGYRGGGGHHGGSGYHHGGGGYHRGGYGHGHAHGYYRSYGYYPAYCAPPPVISFGFGPRWHHQHRHYW